jgi:hypothetical protein
LQITKTNGGGNSERKMKMKLEQKEPRRKHQMKEKIATVVRANFKNLEG